MYQRLLKIVAGLTVSACILLFVSKDALLRRTADRRIAAVEQRHGLHIGYRELTLEGLNTVCMRGLSVVPETGHDTLLTISHLDLRLDFWRMLTGHLQVKHVKLDDLAIFSVGIVSDHGAASAQEFKVSEHVKGLKLRARATGELSNEQINLAGQLREATAYNVETASTTTPGGEDNDDSGQGTFG